MLTNNKLSIIIVTGLLVFCLLSCKGTETSNDNISSSNSNNDKSSTEFISEREAIFEETDAIQSEASGKAKEFWEKKYPKCGDSNYYHRYQKSQLSSDELETFLELKGMTSFIEDWNHEEKSEADRLNEANDPKAVVWKGASKLTVESVRTWSSKRAKYSDTGWDKWVDKSHSDFNTVRMFYLKNGKWQFQETNNDNSSKPVNCEEIPN